MHMTLEQPAVRVAPHTCPAYWEAFCAQKTVDHGDIEVVQVDLAVADATLVEAPVLPEVADDAGGECVRWLEVRDGGRLLDCPVRDCDGTYFGEARRKCRSDSP